MNLKILSERFALLLPISLALISVSRVWDVLPTIMGDEYIYSTQARNLPFSEHSYSNYLFSWVMSFTKVCGSDFYSCTKVINSIFFLGTIIITFFIALRFLPVWPSTFAASVAALSPISIPVSYFMPETMYFFMMTLTVWATLVVSENPKWWNWVVPGFLIGVAALVKPHAVFVAPAILLFALVVQHKSSNTVDIKILLKAGAVSAFGFAVGKFAIGYIFAGPGGLKLFGGYGSPVDALSSAASVDVSNPVAGTSSGTGLSILFGVGSTHLLAHSAAVLLLAGVPLLVGLFSSFRALGSKNSIEGQNLLSLLVVMMTITILPVVSVFEAYVTAIGDDHSDRLIMRYYEFLIPVFIILGLTFTRSPELTRNSRLFLGAIVTGFSMFFVIFYPAVFQKQFADSSTMPGIIANSVLFLALGIVVTAGVVVWVEKPKLGAVIVGWLVIPVVLVSAMASSQTRLLDTNGSIAYFDVAGKTASNSFSGALGEQILVVGKSRTEIFTVKFWIDKPSIKHFTVGEGSILRDDLIKGVKYMVVLGNIEIDVPSVVLVDSDDYQLLRLISN